MNCSGTQYAIYQNLILYRLGRSGKQGLEILAKYVFNIPYKMISNLLLLDKWQEFKRFHGSIL